MSANMNSIMETKIVGLNNFGNITPNPSGTLILDLINPTNGVGKSQMVGRSITVTQLRIRLGLIPLAQTYASIANVPVGNILRMILFLDKQSNTVPALTDVVATITPLSEYNTDNEDRFVIIDDVWFAGNLLSYQYVQNAVPPNGPGVNACLSTHIYEKTYDLDFTEIFDAGMATHTNTVNMILLQSHSSTGTDYQYFLRSAGYYFDN